MQAGALVDRKGEIESSSREGEAGEEAGEESHCLGKIDSSGGGGGLPEAPF